MPAQEDYHKANGIRSEALERGEILDESAAQNKKADTFLPQLKFKKVKNEKGEFKEVSSEILSVDYESKFAKDLIANKQLLLHGVEPTF